MNKKKSKIDTYAIGLLLFCLVFHVIWVFIDGVFLRPDSASYIEMGLSREPVYPLILAFFRSIFGDNYLLVVAFFQSMVRGYAVYVIARTVGYYSKSKYVMPAVTVFFHMCIVFLCRFLAVRKMAYICSIETEGITISLYLLFIVQLLRYVMEHKKQNLIGVVIYSILLYSVRKQMILTFVLVGGVCFLFALMKQLPWKKYCILLGCLLIGFIISLGIPRAYNYMVRGEAITYAGAGSTLLINGLYCSSIEDVTLFKDPEYAYLFGVMMEEIEAQELDYNHVRTTGDWKVCGEHYANSYDAISYGVMRTYIQPYLAETYDLSDIERTLLFDEICKEMGMILTKEHYGAIAEVAFVNIIGGFINTIAKENTYLDWYALFAYMAYLVCGIYCIVKKRRDPATLFFVMVCCSICINALIVGVTIFTQTRYMIYNLSLFYTSFAWMVYSNRALIWRGDT